jgi:hypothetical protein
LLGYCCLSLPFCFLVGSYSLRLLARQAKGKLVLDMT